MFVPERQRPREENARTQPRRVHRLFNNPETLCEGWYPVCPSSELGRDRPKTFKILDQRLAVFRDEQGRPRAVDAFCPHMGADLANGSVESGKLRCFFHGWCFDGSGALERASCGGEPPAGEVGLNSYPADEKYGFVWVYAGLRAAHALPDPAGLGGPATSVRRETTELLAHHHLMMANGIDLRHFGGVHGLHVDFTHEVADRDQGVFDWEVRGKIRSGGVLLRMLRIFFGEELGYVARFAGGSWVSVTYGPDQRMPATGWKWPPLHIVWGCVPLESGKSRVHVFLVTRRRTGVFGGLVCAVLLGATALLLRALKDDDRKGFANMRYSLGRLTASDASVAQFVRRIDELPASLWTPVDPSPEKVHARP